MKEANEGLLPLEDEDLLQEVLLAVVRNPGELRIEASGEVGRGKVLTVHCHPDDRGRVLGKHGACINGIRAVFRAIAASEGRELFVELDEPGRNARPGERRRHGDEGVDRHLRSVRGGRR